MSSKREWLIARGLAKPGRGRLSKEAHEALELAVLDGVQFNEGAIEEYVVPEIEPYVRTRNLKKHLIGYTIEGWEVGFDTCRRCALYMNYCQCKEGILHPSIVVSLDNSTQKAVQYTNGKHGA